MNPSPTTPLPEAGRGEKKSKNFDVRKVKFEVKPDLPLASGLRPPVRYRANTRRAQWLT